MSDMLLFAILDSLGHGFVFLGRVSKEDNKIPYRVDSSGFGGMALFTSFQTHLSRCHKRFSGGQSSEIPTLEAGGYKIRVPVKT